MSMSLPSWSRTAAFVCVLGATAAAAEESPAPAVAAPESFAVHGQFTYVEQESSRFNAPYRGPNSLSPGIGDETVDATLFLGARLWSGAQVWVNGELDQGFGLDDTLGAAGFPSGEAYKVGKKQPYFRLPRAFLRQTDARGRYGFRIATRFPWSMLRLPTHEASRAQASRRSPHSGERQAFRPAAA